MGTRATALGALRAVQLLLLAATVLVCECQQRTALVTDSAGLAASLRDSSVDNIAVKGTVTVDPRDFRTAAVIADRRGVAIESASKLPAERGVIDFGGTADVAHVTAFSALAARSVQLKGLAPPDVRTGLPLHAASVALWPSIRGDPDATFELTETCVTFPLPEGSDSCADYCLGVAMALGSGVSAGGSGAELSVDGQIVLQLPIVAFGAAAGHFMLKVANSTLVCEDHVAASPGYEDVAGSRSWGPWLASKLTARFLLMLAPQAALLATVLVMTMAWWVSRTKRKQCEAERERSADTLTDAAIDAAMSADQRTASGFAQTPDEKGKSSNDDMDTQDGLSLGSMQASPGGYGSLRTASELAVRSGGGAGVDVLGDHHGYLLRMRLEGGLDGIELGPQLGRGSYGKVFKGRWRGALVAVKVVEHTSGGKADVIEGARESLLAASVSHPNVIPCYKICTVAISRRPGSTDAEGFPVSGSSSSGPERTASLVLPDSPVREAAASGLPAGSQEVARRSWERPAEVASPSGAGSSASDGQRGTAGPASPQDPALRCKVAMEHRAGSGGAVSAEEQVIDDGGMSPAGDLPPTAGIEGMQPMSTGSRNEYGAPDSLPISVATAATSGRTTSVGDTSSSSEATIETWMLLEYADRGSLEEAIQNRRFQRKSDKSQLDMLSVFRTLLDIVSGMQYLHSLGLVHGDLKPANVLLKSTVTDSRGFNVKLTDFGLARMLDLNKSHVSTKSFGTIPYMPPELLSAGKMSRKADVFSFGVIAWQIFTGQGPHSGMAPMQVLFNVVEGGLRPDVPQHCPQRYRAMVEDCWAQDPDDRPTFDDLRIRLSSMLEEERAQRAAAVRRVSHPQGSKPRSSSAGQQLGGSQPSKRAAQRREQPQPGRADPEQEAAQPARQPTPPDSLSFDAGEVSQPLDGDAGCGGGGGAGGEGGAAAADEGAGLVDAEKLRRASNVARRASESSAPQHPFQMQQAERQGSRPMPRPSLVHRRSDNRSLSADDAQNKRARDSIGRRVRIAEPMERMRSTSEPSNSVELSRMCNSAAQQEQERQQQSRRSGGARASGAAAAAARLLHAPARLLRGSLDSQRQSLEASQSHSLAGGSLATMSESTGTLSLPDSEPDAWDSNPAAGLDSPPPGAQSPAGGCESSSLESTDSQLRPAESGEAAPPPRDSDAEEARFVRLVKQAAEEGGPARYSLEMGDRRRSGGRRGRRSSSIDGGSRPMPQGDEHADGAHRRRSLDIATSSDAAIRTSFGEASSGGDAFASHQPASRLASNIEGAPPAAPSSGAAGVLSPFTHTRSWRLREASIGSGSSSSQDTHLDAIAAALAAAEREARGGRRSSEQGNPSSSFEGQRMSAEQPPAAPAKQ